MNMENPSKKNLRGLSGERKDKFMSVNLMTIGRFPIFLQNFLKICFGTSSLKLNDPSRTEEIVERLMTSKMDGVVAFVTADAK